MKISEQHINGTLALASVIGMVWLAWVIVSSLQYRQEMACRDGWDRGEKSTECAEILGKAPPVTTPKGAPPSL